MTPTDENKTEIQNAETDEKQDSPTSPKHPDPKHSAEILHQLNIYRKENIKLCDVTLSVEDTKIQCHRSVLAAVSPYFSAMFTTDMKERNEGVVVMQNVKVDVISNILDFIYTGSLDLNIDNVEEVLELAALIQLQSAKELCCEFLEKQIDPTNVIGISQFVALHGCKNFLTKLHSYMRTNFLEVMKTEEFYTLTWEVLKALICDQSLKVDKEEQVYEAVIKWVKHNEDTEPLYKLLSEVKLPLLSKAYIMEEVDNEPLVKQNLKCRDLLDEAKNFYLQPEHHSKMRNWRTLPRFSRAGLLFAVGGKETGELITDKAECFCLYEGRWKSISSLSCQRQQLCLCECNGNIYAIAGTDGTTRMKTVEMYSLEKNTWSDVPSLQVCRSGAGATSMNNVMYVVSGYDGRVCLTSVERYDEQAERWDYVASISTGRSFSGVTSYGGRLYVVGGNDGLSFLNTCEVYDPLSNRWSKIAPMSTARAGIGCAVQDGIIYAAGGFDGIQRLDTVELYEPRMDAWTLAPSMRFNRDGVSLASYGGFVHAVGGIDGPSYLNTVEYYDPLSETWNRAFSMRTSRAAAGVAVLTSEKYISLP